MLDACLRQGSWLFICSHPLLFLCLALLHALRTLWVCLWAPQAECPTYTELCAPADPGLGGGGGGAGPRARSLQFLARRMQLAGEVGGRLGVLLQLRAQHGGSVAAATQLLQEAALLGAQAAAQRRHQRLALRHLPP